MVYISCISSAEYSTLCLQMSHTHTHTHTRTHTHTPHTRTHAHTHTAHRFVHRCSCGGSEWCGGSTLCCQPSQVRLLMNIHDHVPGCSWIFMTMYQGTFMYVWIFMYANYNIYVLSIKRLCYRLDCMVLTLRGPDVTYSQTSILIYMGVLY